MGALIFYGGLEMATVQAAARRFGIALAVSGAVFGLGGTRPSSAGPGPSLTFSERFGDIVVQRQVTQRGQFRIDAVLPLGGVDINTFNGATRYHVSIGNLGESGELGEDPRYRPGRRRATITDGVMRITLRWNRNRVRIRVTSATGTFPPLQLPIQADDFLDDASGPVSGATSAFVQFAGLGQRFDVPYNGQRTENRGRRNVSLSGTGAPSP
jgi:hypothetical protein